MLFKTFSQKKQKISLADFMFIVLKFMVILFNVYCSKFVMHLISMFLFSSIYVYCIYMVCKFVWYLNIDGPPPYNPQNENIAELSIERLKIKIITSNEAFNIFVIFFFCSWFFFTFQTKRLRKFFSVFFFLYFLSLEEGSKK